MKRTAILLGILLLCATTLAAADGRQRAASPIGHSQPIVWQTATFSSAPQAFAFAASRTTRFVIRTSEAVPRYVVIYTLNTDGGEDNFPAVLTLATDRAAAVAFLDTLKTPVKGVVNHGDTWIVWWIN